ncbi:hypothetical protein DFA_06834 [Cavenderia fasciculata]|uniref:ComC supersandwich domain-containing protein n=1 Tax=Cavenderia fasciculata TaxID=261658 RepID=F4Q2E7_CACFS|nr:uncharacterized protein DFA_06834 [Cavenderia fasciculata]EGG18167.1 hypothetical protein DFA_06834 [Cavenderia fasciculata]|eukprot:XP_004366208.1 hypothetical protein DFA_06834 [Cavenderia fasciculata]
MNNNNNHHCPIYITAKRLVNYNTINVSWVIDPPGHGPITVLFNVSQSNLSNVTRDTFTDNRSWVNFPVGLDPANYTFHITAVNEGTTRSNSLLVRWLGPLIISHSEITKTTTNKIQVTLEVVGSDVHYFKLNITVNNMMTTTNFPVIMEGPDFFVVQIEMPESATTPVSIVAFDDDGRVSNTVYFDATTYPVISNLSLQVLQVYDAGYFIVTAHHDGGVPGDTYYTFGFRYSSQTPEKQKHNSTLYILPDDLTVSYPINITIDNDLKVLFISTVETEITFYNFPTINSTNSTSDYESIYLTWISDGGMPGNITYQVSVSNPKSTIQVPLIWCLGSNISSCLITGLTSNTEYSIEVQMSSVQFLPINQTIFVSTLQYPNNYTCIDRQGINNSVECNGFGEFLPFCGGNGDGGEEVADYRVNSHVEPSPNKPKAVVNNADIFYQFVVSQIRELDIDQNIINNSNSNSIYRTIKITFLQYVQQDEEEETTPTSTPKDIPVTFAGQLFYVTVGSIKYTIDIEGWNFGSQLNTLELVTNITQPYNDKDQDTTIVNNNIVSTNSTDFTSFVIGTDQLVLGKLINRALLDDIPRKVSNRIVSVPLSPSSSSSSSESQQQMLYSIITTIPYFNLNAVFDPELQLLVKPNDRSSSSSSSNSWKIVVGVVVGFVVVAAVSVATIFYRIKMNTQRRDSISRQERFRAFSINNN